MEPYYLNGKNLETYGITAGLAPDSDLAISGMLDMPSRIGKVYHDWADENGVEPYLRADELFYGGRDIMFHGFIKANDEIEGQQMINDIFFDLDAFNSLVPFASEFGTWSVYVSAEIKVTYYSAAVYSLVITMREPIVDLSGLLPSAIGDGIGLDGIPFKNIGLTLMATNNAMNRPSAKGFDKTAYGYEAYQTTKCVFREFSLKLLIQAESYGSLKSIVAAQFAILSKPGARTITLLDGTTRECFAKDGFKVSGVRIMENIVVGIMEITFAEIRLLKDWNKLTTNLGELLVDKHGTPLTEILKKL